MKRYLTMLVCILYSVLCTPLLAQIEHHVTWSGEDAGDSVRIKAVVDPDWHMTIIEFGDLVFTQELKDSFEMTVAKTDLAPIRYNACNDIMCTAPETWEYSNSPQDGLTAEGGLTAQRSNSASGLTSNSASGLLIIFLLGMLGGLLAIFTPCVWPIIPMTVSFFLKKGGGKRDAVLYGLSIIVLYVGLGLLVTILFGASALNELSTNAIVNLFFFALLVVFALSFFGLFEITLPDSWSTALDSKARSTGGFLSILLMAFTLVIVSFSCTGPIIGTLLVEAAGHSLLAPAIGMLGFAIALALPFSLFAMFPQWLKQAPKSGDWMTSFKVVLAFLELALSLKFLSVADLAYNWGILPRWLFLVLWIACFAGIGIYLLWHIGRVNTTRKIIRTVVIIPSFLFAAYLVPGLWGAPVKAVSAFAPPMPIEGREVFYHYEEGMAYARQEHKPVVIDFTGYGCVNCRKMEAFVLSNDSVKVRLQNYVFIELYVDDRRVSEDEQRTNGEINSRIQREQFGSNAQPFFVQLDENGTMLAEPMAFTTDPQAFLDWLIK